MEQDSSAPNPLAPLEPGDWYFEGPNVVFTAQYLLKRGTCCKSGCRNCPYGFAAAPAPTGPGEDGSGGD